MNFAELTRALDAAFAAGATPNLATHLDGLTIGPQETWKAAVVRLAVAAVRGRGLGGLKSVQRVVVARNFDLFPPAWADPRVVSDFVAHLQSAEDARWAEAEALVADVERVLVAVVLAVLGGLLPQDGPG